MSLTDPLADMLTRIRNGQQANLALVKCPYSNLKFNVLNVMLSEGYIEKFTVEELSDGIKNLSIKLKYISGTPVIKKIQKVSTPGRRIYSSIKDLKKYYNGLGISILSTSKGVMSDYKASSINIGGEILCNIY